MCRRAYAQMRIENDRRTALSITQPGPSVIAWPVGGNAAENLSPQFFRREAPPYKSRA
jgi:hypothetical protein